MGKTF